MQSDKIALQRQSLLEWGIDISYSAASDIEKSLELTALTLVPQSAVIGDGQLKDEKDCFELTDLETWLIALGPVARRGIMTGSVSFASWPEI